MTSVTVRHMKTLNGRLTISDARGYWHFWYFGDDEDTPFAFTAKLPTPWEPV